MRNPILKAFLPLVLLTGFISACEKDADDSLRGCCGNAALDETFGNGHIYLPNIFTPDGDGINDQLQLCAESLLTINSLKIENRSGKVVFEVLNIAPNDPNIFWDGRVNGTVMKGVYKARITATAQDGTQESFTVNVCNYPCGAVPQDEFVSKTICQFGDQVVPGCNYDIQAATNQPDDCFN